MWRGALQGVRTSRASFFTTSLVAPLVCWGLVVLLSGFNGGVVIKTLLPVLAMVPIGVASSITVNTLRKGGTKAAAAYRRVALLLRVYYVTILLEMSVYLLIMGIYFTAGLPSRTKWVAPALLVMFLSSILAAIVWAPSSLPRTAEDDAIADRRAARWLPWVMGLQGALIGIGVFFGAWIMHDDTPWGGLLAAGLSSLLALLLVLIGVLGIHRFVVMVMNPIPAEVQKEFGLVA